MRIKRKLLRSFIDAQLATKQCVDCGINDPIVLQFDHVRGTKVNDVSRLVRASASEQAILEEIAKCEIRCANCHQRRTTLQARAALGIPTAPI
jgi:hypothetical protein